MKRSAALLLTFLLLATGTLPAQEAPASWSLVPQLRLGRLGDRWTRAGNTPIELGAGTAPAFGAALEHRPGGRLSYELAGSMAFTDYAIDLGPERVRGAGSLRLLRLGAGVLYRMRADVPGYFSAGAGALLHWPVERVRGFQDDRQWMPSAHAGAGIDIAAGGGALRLDARLHAVRPTQDEIESGSQPLEARTALDLLFSIGYVIGL